MYRLLSILLLIVGTLCSAYLGWASYRMKDEVLMQDRSWPRPSPYPDNWLLSLNNWFDARHPGPPGTIKLHGEIARVRMAISYAFIVASSVALCGGLPLAWPWFRRARVKRRGFEVVSR